MKEKLVREIAENIEDELDRQLQEGPEGEDLSIEVDKEAIRRFITPIVEEALKPILNELDELRSVVDNINTALPGAFTSIGAGTAAAGAAGAAAYQKTGTKSKKKLLQIGNDIKKISSNS